MSKSQFRAALVILGALVGTYVLSHFYRVSTSVIGPDLMRDLALSPEALSTLAAAFFLAFAASQIPIGMMLDRLGTRITIPALLSFAVAGSLLFAAAESEAGLTVARGLMGIGCAGVFIGALVVCTRWFPPERFATLAALMVAMGNAGNLLATTPLAAASEYFGWRGAFVAMAVISAVIAVLGYLIIRDAPPGHAFHEREAESLGSILKGVGEVFRNPLLPVMFVMSFVTYSGIVTILGLWGGPYLHDVHGLGPVPRGNVLLVMTVTLIIGTAITGPLDRYFDTRKKVAMTGGVATVVVLALLALVPDPPLWQATVLLALFASFNGYAIVILAHGRTIFPDHLVGRGMTTLTISTMGGVAVIQWVSGRIVGAFVGEDGLVEPEGYRVMFAFIAAILAAALVYYSRMPDAKPSLDRAIPSAGSAA